MIPFRVLPIAGSRVLNANMTAIIYGKSIYLVDSGKGLSDPSDKIRVLTPRLLSKTPPVLPRFDLLNTYLQQGYVIRAVMVTHIHNDHTGSLKELKEYLESWAQDPDYYADARVEVMMKNLRVGYRSDRHISLVDGVSFHTPDGLKITPIQVNHSTLGCMSLVFQSEYRTLYYLPDFVPDYDNAFGVDQNQVDLKFGALGKHKIDALVCQSTTATLDDGSIPVSEQQICAKIKNYLAYYHGKKQGIIVSGFGTNVRRVCAVIQQSIRLKRKVLVIGRSANSLVNAYFTLGYLDKNHRGQVYDLKKINLTNFPKSKYVIMTSGHQGQFQAGLTKMARDQLRFYLGSKDVVLLCSTTIPKIGPIINRGDMVNNLLQKRVTVVPNLHKSGHITGSELVHVVRRLKPKMIIANHGDYHQQAGWYKIAALADLPLEVVHLGKNGLQITIP